jgi:hypothetical protein
MNLKQLYTTIYAFPLLWPDLLFPYIHLYIWINSPFTTSSIIYIHVYLDVYNYNLESPLYDVSYLS